MVLGPGVKTGLNIMMDNPGQLGADLVANAVAGIHEYPLPLAIIDMGTASTVSVVDEKKALCGRYDFSRNGSVPGCPHSPCFSAEWYQH